MEQEGPLSNCDSDSSDGLPDLFPEYIFDIAKLEKNDVVWAEYKDLYWPALVRNVDKRNKKVKVWYLDSPGKCFKVPFKKIHDYADSDFSKKVDEDAKTHPLSKKHVEVRRKTEVFLFRQFKGIDDNPLDFFDLSKPYFLLQALNSRALDTKLQSDSNLEITAENSGSDDSKEKSKDEIVVESDGESDITAEKCLPELVEDDSPYDDEMVDQILSYITSGNVDNYLIGIVNSKIANKRHKLYVEAVKKGQVELFVESQPSIPIKSQKLHNVSVYLHKLYNDNIKNKNMKKLNEYIVSVWLPEAVTKAISVIEAKSPNDSCGNSKSSSPLVSDSIVDRDSNFLSLPVLESSELPNEHGNKVCSSSTDVDISQSLVVSDSDNKSSSVLQVEQLNSTFDSSSTDELGATKRKNSLVSSSLDKHNSNEPEIEASSPRKKQFRGRKKQGKKPKSLKCGKISSLKIRKTQKNNFTVSISGEK